MKRKIILDVDTGSDDALAIGLALNNPDFEILGITVTWGNQPVECCTRNTLKICHYFNRDDIKVYKGESSMMDPQKREKMDVINPMHPIWYNDDKGKEHNLHPRDFDLEEPLHKEEEKDAVTFLIDTLMNSKEKITLVPIGPTSNIGMAFKKCPEIKDHIEEIVFMGGSVRMGNVSPSAEANFYNDPDALHEILKSNVKCTFLALNATHSAGFTMSDADHFKELGTKGGQLAYNVIKWRADVSKNLGWSDGKVEVVHDPLTVAYLIDPSVVDCLERHKVDVDTSVSMKYGTLILDEETGNENVDIAMHAIHDRYVEILNQYLG